MEICHPRRANLDREAEKQRRLLDEWPLLGNPEERRQGRRSNRQGAWVSLVLGIDPDSRCTAWAVVSPTKIIAVGVIRGPSNEDVAQIVMLRNSGFALEAILKRHNIQLAVVEGQAIHHGSKARPADILKLGIVAGGCAGQIAYLQPSVSLAIPLPADWKGTTPKPINQLRTFTHFGVLATKGAEYATPDGCAAIAAVDGASQVKRGDWKHLGDALGLALYGQKLLISK